MIKFCTTCKGTRTKHTQTETNVKTSGPCPNCKDTTFGERLYQLMLDRKLRVRDLAYRLDINDDTVYKYLKNYSSPSYKTLDKMIALLNPSDKEFIWLMRGELRDE